MAEVEIIEITPQNIFNYGICGYKNIKNEGYPEKISWIKQNYTHGLRIKSILTAKDGIQGTIIWCYSCYKKRLVYDWEGNIYQKGI
jgi:hypothetical protein